MVPKESGFNQSEMASGKCALRVWQFSMLACHGKGCWSYTKASFLSSRRHNLPSKVKLCNNQTVRNVYMWMQQWCDLFRQSNIHVSYRHRIPATIIWPRQSLGGGCQSSEMAALFNSLSFAFTNPFLPKYRVKYFDYIVKWCSGIWCN